MHNAAYQAMDLNFVYIAFGTEDTAGAVAAIRALGIRGLGVTMPHKVRIMDFLDVVEETARAIGAVNTVVNDHGVLTGHNVDWIGAVRAFEEHTPLSGRHAAVVGAGGGARSIVYGLIRQGCRVTLYNRRESSGRALASDMGAAFGGPPAALADAALYDLLAHATPVGFHAPEETLIPESALRPGMIVFDAVPMPVETKLLRQAKAHGCVSIPGVRMQIHRARGRFCRHGGRLAPGDESARGLTPPLADHLTDQW
jgi:shikimate dehydrogenase